MKLAVWIAGVLIAGWLVTAGTAVVFPRGHPPMVFYAGMGVVFLSAGIAPIGIVAAVVSIVRTRRRSERTSRLAVAALVLNTLFLLVAVSLWFLLLWESRRR